MKVQSNFRKDKLNLIFSTLRRCSFFVDKIDILAERSTHLVTNRDSIVVNV